jgi:hypothetical protein
MISDFFYLKFVSDKLLFTHLVGLGDPKFILTLPDSRNQNIHETCNVRLLCIRAILASQTHA